MEMLNTNWSNDRIERLQELYLGGMSFRLIANEIGMSRNAVIGKAHRLQLPARPPPLVRLYNHTAPKRRRERKAPVVVVSLPEPIPDRDYSCAIHDLDDASCRYPLWDTSTVHADRFYCGHPSASMSTGIPYCDRHALICGGPPRPN